jgi:hypothetical protein
MTIYKYARIVVSLLLPVVLFGCSASKPAQTGVKVTDINVGRSVTADKTINEKTDSFRPGDTVYVSVKTDGSAPSESPTSPARCAKRTTSSGVESPSLLRVCVCRFPLYQRFVVVGFESRV